MSDEIVRVWQIGPDGTEYYAAHSEEEIKAYYREICGSEEHCEEDLRDHFEEVDGLDVEFDYNDDGKMIRTTWRKLAEDSVLPAQLSSGYV
jgi:hypothetical protein